MANTYRNIWKADATTNIVTVYTCPAETVAIVKSISAYNTHASSTPDWTLTVTQSSSATDFIYKVFSNVAAKGKKEFLEGDALKFTTTITTANISVNVLQQDRT